MKTMMARTQAATVNAKDIEKLKDFWADDVTLTFVGQPPIEGKAAVERWYRTWFDSIKEIRAVSTNFAPAHPYAWGGTNTMLFEENTEIEYLDGRRTVKQSAAAIDIHKGKAKHIRVYVADEDGGKVLMGSRAT